MTFTSSIPNGATNVDLRLEVVNVKALYSENHLS